MSAPVQSGFVDQPMANPVGLLITQSLYISAQSFEDPNPYNVQLLLVLLNSLVILFSQTVTFLVGCGAMVLTP